MAWNYGKIRWQMQFNSRRNVACRVDIYMRDYTGNDVTQLTGAETPVSWDEDNDEDLLNAVRLKTGYINVIENTYHELNGLHPAHDIDHYVEVYYNNTLAFSGFMQAESFDSPYAPGPRSIKFPIMSPLGVANGITMPVVSTPEYITLGTLLYRAIGMLPANITQIIFPTSIVLDTNYSVTLMWKLLTLVYCKYSGDFDNYREHDQDLFMTESVEYVIDAICNGLGLMCHDFPGMLVFVKVDYAGTYGVYTVDSLTQENITPASTIDSSVVTNYSDTTILSNKGKETNITPIKKLTINYDGDSDKKAELADVYDHAKYWAWFQTVVDGQGITYKNFDPAVTSDFWNNGYFPTDNLTPPPYGEDTKHGLWLAEFGKQGMTKKILYRAQQYTYRTTPILKWTMWKVPTSAFKFQSVFSMHLERGEGSSHLSKAIGITIYLRFKIGDKYWDGTDWVTTSSYVSVTSDQDGNISYAIPGRNGQVIPPSVMTIEILAGDMQSMSYLYAFSDVSFGASSSEIFDKVIPEPLQHKDLQRDNGAIMEDSIDANINVAVDNFCQLISPTDGIAAVGQPSAYSYMFQSRMRTVIDTMLAISPNIYVQKIKFVTEYPRRRIISCGFTPSEDEMAISMQGMNNL